MFLKYFWPDLDRRLKSNRKLGRYSQNWKQRAGNDPGLCGSNISIFTIQATLTSMFWASRKMPKELLQTCLGLLLLILVLKALSGYFLLHWSEYCLVRPVTLAACDSTQTSWLFVTATTLSSKCMKRVWGLLDFSTSASAALTTHDLITALLLFSLHSPSLRIIYFLWTHTLQQVTPMCWFL